MHTLAHADPRAGSLTLSIHMPAQLPCARTACTHVSDGPPASADLAGELLLVVRSPQQQPLAFPAHAPVYPSVVKKGENLERQRLYFSREVPHLWSVTCPVE